MTVFINNKGAHRMGDQNRHCGGMGTLVEGSPNVIVGETGGGGSGGGGSGGGGSGGSGSGGTGGGGGSGSGGSTGSSNRTMAAPSSGRSLPIAGPPLPPTSPTPPGEQVPLSALEVVVVDQEGKPQSGIRYEVEDANGKIHEGTTNPEGLVRVDGLPPGMCKVSLPDLDTADWRTS